jgi:glycosyltransferase involved in cell wall biosynthesis
VILVLHPSDELYGADRVLLETIPDLQRHEEVRVWLPTDLDYPHRPLSAALAATGVDVQRHDLPVLRRANATPRGVVRLAGIEARFAGALRRVRPSHLYVNTSALAPAIPVAAALRIPTTVHIHETWGQTDRRILGPLCHTADQVIVVSEAARLALSPSLRQRALIRRHQVDAGPADPVAVATLRNDRRRPLLLFASRWTPNKGIVELLHAVTATDAGLIVLGGPPPSGAAVDVPGLVAELGLGQQVDVVGEVSDVWPYLYACDAVVVPTVGHDSYPTIALEGVAAGRPVLASSVGGLPEILARSAGELLPPGDVAALSAAIARLRLRVDLQE